MSEELEAIGAASIGAVARDTTGDGYLNGPCLNCGTGVDGQFCSNCGQSANDLKKPFVSLFRDMLGDILSFDGRLWRTVPSLMFRPGHITRSYIDGKRMRYVPPFRLFLIASVLFFLVLFGVTEKQGFMQGDDLDLTFNGATFSNVIVDGKPLSAYEGFDLVFDDAGDFSREGADTFVDQLLADDVIDADDINREALLGQLERMNASSFSRQELLRAVQKWLPRLSFLLLPSYVLSLTILHFWIRRIYIFDHVIVALHMQSLFYLLATIGMLARFIHPGIVWGVFGMSTLVYPFLLMRKAYGTNWFFNLFRVLALFIGTFFTGVMLIVLIAFVTASDLGLVSMSEILGSLENAPSGFSEGWENFEAGVEEGFEDAVVEAAPATDPIVPD